MKPTVRRPKLTRVLVVVFAVQIELFESILCCSFAEEQRKGGKHGRERLDTLTLGLIVSMQYAIGKRGITLESIVHGNLAVDQFSKKDVWPGIKPLLAVVKNVRWKADGTNGPKHLDEMFHHQCPLRCPIAMQGLCALLYANHIASCAMSSPRSRIMWCAFADFAFQLFNLGITLPTVENWNDEAPKENPPGHHQFLFRLQTGGQADISSFASKLREDAQLIGAVYADKLSPHLLRHIRIAECGEEWDMSPDDNKHVTAHEPGQFEKVYKDRDVKKLLSGAGYTAHLQLSVPRFFMPQLMLPNPPSMLTRTILRRRVRRYRPKEPGELSPWVRTLHEYMGVCTDERSRKDDGCRIVDFLYARHRPDVKALEERVEKDSSEVGKQIRQWLAYVRFCILSWVVSAAARPLNTSFFIDESMPMKRLIMAGARDHRGGSDKDILCAHLDCILVSDDYRRLEERVRSNEQAYINMGEIAHATESERRMTLRLNDGFDAIGSQLQAQSTVIQALPGAIAGELQPRFDAQERDLSNEIQVYPHSRPHSLHPHPFTLLPSSPPFHPHPSRSLSSHPSPQLGYDRDYLNSLSAEDRSRRFAPIALGVLSEKEVVGTQQLRDARLEDDRQKRDEAKSLSLTTLSTAALVSRDQEQDVLMPGGFRLHLPTRERPASDGAQGTVAVPPGPRMVDPSASVIKPSELARAIVPPPPQTGLPTALGVPSPGQLMQTSDVASTSDTTTATAAASSSTALVVAAAATPADTGANPTVALTVASAADPQRQIDQLRAQLAEHTTDEPVEVEVLTGGVRQAFCIYLHTVVPKERKQVGEEFVQSKDWRAAKTFEAQGLSAKEAEARHKQMRDRVNTYYEPLALAVMQRHMDETVTVTVLAAIAALEELRQEAARDRRFWKAWCKALPKCEDEKKRLLMARLLHPDFTAAFKAELAAEHAPVAAAEPSQGDDEPSEADNGAPTAVPALDGAVKRHVPRAPTVTALRWTFASPLPAVPPALHTCHTHNAFIRALASLQVHGHRSRHLVWLRHRPAQCGRADHLSGRGRP
jgi:hypothetical protein